MRPPHRRLHLEALEDRLTPSTFTVANLNDGGAGSLRNAIGQAFVNAGDDTVQFAAGLTGTINLLSGLSFGDTTGLTRVIGPGAGLITVQPGVSTNFSIVTVNTGVAVELDGLTIANGNAGGGVGGGVNNNGTLTVSACTFSGNQGGAGGGLFNAGTATVTGSTFTNNSCPTFSFGGGIFTQGTLTVTTCTFTTNTSLQGGGALCVNGGTAAVTDSSFTGNTATRTDNNGGGAILDRNGGALTVTTSNFTNNTANFDGGAILAAGAASLTVSAGTFTNNGADNDSNGSGAGGAINNSATAFAATGCIFTSNHSTGLGGGAIFHNSSGPNTVAASKFTSNSAVTGGGIDNFSGTLLITACTFTTNSATGNAGGLHSGGDSVLTGCTFTGNTAVLNGGAVQNENNLTAFGCTFTGNTVTGNGNGGGVENNAGVVTVTNSTFSNNAAGQVGGGLNNFNGTVTVTNSTFVGNTSAGSGGALVNNGGTLTLMHVTATGNRADSDGNAVGAGGGLANFGGTATLLNSVVAGNLVGQGTTAGDIGVNNVNAASANNVIGTGGAGGLTNGTNGNQVGVNAQLDTLKNNGGPTRTVALLPNSPALNAGAGELLFTPTAVTSAAAATDIFPASQLIDGSGLSATPTAANLAGVSHTGTSQTLWESNSPGGFGTDYFASGGVPPVLTFTLGGTFALTDMVVWGYDLSGSGDGNEAKSLQVAFSTNGGATFGPAVSVTRGACTGTGDARLSFGGTHFANAVKVTITDNFFGQAGSSGGGELVGLGEVKFLGAVGTDQRGTGRDAVPDAGAYEVQHPLSPVGVPTDMASVYAPHPSADASTAFVKGLYQAALLRAGSANEVTFYVNQLNANTLSKAQAGKNFYNSPENRGNEVKFFYSYFLNRTPSQAEVDFYVTQLQGGKDDAQVMRNFILSPEYTGQNNNTQFVNTMYYATLGRGASAAEVAFYVTQLNANTATRDQVLANFLHSPEGIGRVVRGDYIAYLERLPTSAEVTAATSQIAGGATFGSVAFGLLGGAEFFANAGNNL